MSLPRGSRAGSVAARRVLPFLLLSIPGVVVLWRVGQNAGLYSTRVGTVLLGVTLTALAVVWVLVMTRRLNRLDAERDAAHQRAEQHTAELTGSRLETLQRLALAAEYRDDDTYQHTERVGQLAALLAERLGLTEEQVLRIRQAAPLHDVGKVAISDSILLKPGRLTPQEFDTVKAHTVVGARILRASTFDVLQMAERIALYHHERWDGQGYPMGLPGPKIPIAARIVAVADVYDALTHDRPYKAAWPHTEAVAEIERMAATQFDPEIVAALGVLDRAGLLPDEHTEQREPSLAPIELLRGNAARFDRPLAQRRAALAYQAHRQCKACGAHASGLLCPHCGGPLV